jgi:hypothetical protein
MVALKPVKERILLNNHIVMPKIADNVVTLGTHQLFAQHQVKGELNMNRSVCKFGLAAALVVWVLAFSTSPAQAQVYVSRYYAPTPGYSYYYPPSYYYSGCPSYYPSTYTSYYYAPGYSSYYSVPAYHPYYPYRRAYVGWRGGWYGRGWHGRYRWR